MVFIFYVLNEFNSISDLAVEKYTYMYDSIYFYAFLSLLSLDLILQSFPK